MRTKPEQVTETDERCAAFTTFFRDAEPRLRVSLAAALGQDRGRDAAAEALSYGWEHWDRIQAMDNPIAYLYRVGQSKTRLPKQRYLRQVPDSGLPDIEPRLPTALKRLSDGQRVAVVLVHGFGWTHAEVASLMDIATPTVATHVRRGLEKSQSTLRVHARTSGVFDVSPYGTLGYIVELTEPDSGQSTLYAVEIEMSGGQITSLIERRLGG